MEKEIKKLIRTHLLNVDEKKMDEIYKTFDVELKTSELKGFFEQWGNNELFNSFQIDFPYFINSSRNKNIMIVAQDPNNKKNEKKIIKINTPFSYHQNGENEYNKFINDIKSNVNVYITDLYKLFFLYSYKGEIINDIKKSHYFPSYTINDIHYEILKKEIMIIKPDLIIAFGNVARIACAKLGNIVFENNVKITNDKTEKPYKFKLMREDFNTNFIAIPHPSNSTYENHWKDFIKSKKIASLGSRGEQIVEFVRRYRHYYA